MSVSTGSQVANILYPGDRCCQIFKKRDFAGDWLLACLNEGELEGEVNVRDHGFNNNMSSWWCGKDIAYDFCDGRPGTNCQAAHGTSGAGSIKNSNAHQFNNELTTMYLYSYS